MTNQQHFASKLRLSRLCRWILAIGALKLAALAVLAILPPDMLNFSSDTDSEKNRPVPMTVTKNDQKGEQSLGTLLSDSLAVRGKVAHAAESPDSVNPPAPRVRPSQSPFSQDPLTNSDRPDAAMPSNIPAPQLNPYIPRDSAYRKEEELNRREQELLSLQQQMQHRLDELKNVESKVQGMLKQANNMQDDKLRHLIDVYSNMKAKQAADVLSTLDERIAVKILAGMRGKQAGEILTYMRPQPAAKLSELLSRTQLPDR